MEISKNRDINNKLRACLLNIKVADYSLDDFINLFQHLSEGKENKLDTKLVY
jgi:hypothetical protein